MKILLIHDYCVPYNGTKTYLKLLKNGHKMARINKKQL